MITEVIRYQVVCDRCHKTCGNDEIINVWYNKEIAEEFASRLGWHKICDEHYCPDCVDYNKKYDLYVPKGSIE